MMTTHNANLPVHAHISDIDSVRAAAELFWIPHLESVKYNGETFYRLTCGDAHVY